MSIHLSNEPFRTNSCTIAQDPYPWKTTINIMHFRKMMGYSEREYSSRYPRLQPRLI